MSVARIAVVGTGWWATNHHLPALRDDPRAQIVALVDPDDDARHSAAHEFGVARAHADMAELLREGGVDGVVVATPHASHYEVAARALGAGLHVLIEKPMTLNAEEAWDLVHRSRRNGVQLTVGYENQHTAHAARAKEIIRSGELGPLQLVAAVCATPVEHYYRGVQPDQQPLEAAPPREGPGERTYSDPAVAGGGQGQTQVTHTMGMVVHVTGAVPCQVAAAMSTADLDVDLVDAIAFRLDNGAVGTVSATGNIRSEDSARHEVTYYARDGFLVQSLTQGSLRIHRHDADGGGVTLVSGERPPTDAPARCLVNLCLGGDRNPAPGDEGARVVQFLEDGYRSARESRAVDMVEH